MKLLVITESVLAKRIKRAFNRYQLTLVSQDMTKLCFGPITPKYGKSSPDSPKMEIVKLFCDRVLLKWFKRPFNYYQMKIFCQDIEFIPTFTHCKFVPHFSNTGHRVYRPYYLKGLWPNQIISLIHLSICVFMTKIDVI